MFRYVVLAALFFILSPGNFLRLPRNGSKRMVALVHTVVFVVAYYLSEKLAEMLNVKDMEGFRSELAPIMNAPTMAPVATKPSGPAFAPLAPLFPTLSDKANSKIIANMNECTNIKRRKDAEYKARGDKTPLFRSLDKQQGIACDRVNNDMNKVHDMGIRLEKPWTSYFGW